MKYHTLFVSVAFWSLGLLGEVEVDKSILLHSHYLAVFLIISYDKPEKMPICQLGDMVKRLGSDYDSPKHISFLITNSLYSPKRVSWPIVYFNITFNVGQSAPV